VDYCTCIVLTVTPVSPVHLALG